MTDLRSLTLAGFERLCLELGWKSYRAHQVYSWLWQKGVADIDAMTNLGKDKRRQLALGHAIRSLALERDVAAEDGTRKFTWRLCDGAVVESVFIPEPDRRTVCISTQVGCGLGCEFCCTGRMGLVRNLGWHEIAGQVLEVKKRVQGVKESRGQVPGHRIPEPSAPGTLEPSPAVSNVVLMGMGEPFLNYDAVVQALTELNSDFGLNIGARKMTVSTAGIPDAIRRYARLPLQSRLAISLNASDDETRSRLMPVNRRHPLQELIAAVREFTSIRNKRVTFEYVLIDGVNNRSQDVKQLSKLLAGIPCKVNLIPLNPFPGCQLKPPSALETERFRRALFPHLPAVTVRRSRGAEIGAACGQLVGAGGDSG